MTASRDYYPGYSGRMPKQITGVHLAAYFGLREATMALTNNGNLNPDIRDFVGRAPLSFAAEHGHEAVLKLLLAKKKRPPRL
jgi:ankyrin repeat protein